MCYDSPAGVDDALSPVFYGGFCVFPRGSVCTMLMMVVTVLAAWGGGGVVDSGSTLLQVKVLGTRDFCLSVFCCCARA